MEIGKLIKGCVRNPLLFRQLLEIRKRIYKPIGKLEATYSKTSEPVSYEDRLNLIYNKISIGDNWGGFFDCAWFNFKGNVPKEYKGKNIQLIIDINGEGCVFDDSGCPVKGLSKRLCIADALNTVKGKLIYVPDNVTEDIDIWVETGNNGWDGKSTGQAKLKRADIVICNDKLYDYYFDYLTLYMLLITLDIKSDRYSEVLRAIKKSSKLLRKYSDIDIENARNVLLLELEKSTDDEFVFHAVGHAHLDLAWLWPIRETKRKAARTFSNQLNLIENNSDYIFGASQPQQFQWMKDLYPALYAKIKKAVDIGQLELQGGMWVESDTNVVGAESLVRQILYGKRFFREEFNKDMRIVWLPDVFGFSGALPQLIKKSGMEYFLTIKLSWNEQNKFPYHSFIWEGIDGSDVLVHMPPEGTYNSEMIANSISHAYSNYKEEFTDCALLPYGVGDGGGGPSESHYNLMARQKDLKGSKKIEPGTAIEFFDKLKGYYNKLPRHRGELYLEKHQGTLTSQAKNKLFNRKIEILLRNIEILSVYAVSKGYIYPREVIENIWKEVLLYQFHDIIPGSSIHRVYVESVERYLIMIGELKKIENDIFRYLSEDKEQLTAFNPLQYNINEWIKINDEWLYIDAKPFSTATLKLKEYTIQKRTDNSIENDKIKIIFNPDGSISSYIDIADNINYCGEYFNRLTVYKDKKLHYNAWDIDINYTKKITGYFELQRFETITDGPSVIRRNHYSFNKSTLIQDVILTEGKEYAIFNTKVEWQETHRMLRAEFRPSVFSDNVLCDIQWGNIERSTRTDNPIAYAQYEICAHKYVDVSDQERGLSLINDCKYGHRVKDGLISLNLLRSPVFPDETADKGEQNFTYAVYAHKGKALDSRLLEHAYILNNPPIITEYDVSIDKLFSIDKDNIIIETIKQSEDSGGVIIRLFESKGKQAKARLYTQLVYDKAYECDLMEENDRDISLNNLEFYPYEIKTIKLKGR